MDENKMPFLESTAKVNLTIGVAYIEKLQQAVASILESKNEDELKEWENYTIKEEDYPEEWMLHLYLLSSLLAEITKKAEEQGLVKYTNE